MKQTTPNPWDQVAERYPVGAIIDGTVRNLTNYGAFIEIEEGIDGLLHVSDMSWTRKISHASEMLQKGDKIRCQVLSVDQQRKRIALGLKQLAQDPWEAEIPQKYHPGTVVTGTVTKLTNFGVFVQLEPNLEGLLHISELSDQKVENPEQIVKVGDAIEVRILRVDHGRPQNRPEPQVDSAPRRRGRRRRDRRGDSTAPREELKGGRDGGSSGPLFSMETPEE